MTQQKNSGIGGGCLTIVIIVIVVAYFINRPPPVRPDQGLYNVTNPTAQGSDLRVTSFRAGPMIQGQPIRAGQPILLWISVTNQGTLPSGPWRVTIKRRDPYGRYIDLVLNQPRSIGPGETDGVVAQTSALGPSGPPTININQPGAFQVEVIVESQGDINPANDRYATNLQST